MEYKTAIEQWEPPRDFQPPDDLTSDVQHSLNTAQAYRWVTLLYLHQAVPEIPSESAAELARRVLVLIATVPPTSRTIIIQIYPLLVASCEAESEEDRVWVRQPWATTQSRLKIRNNDRCYEIVCEVWRRRDAFARTNQRVKQVPFVAPVDTVKRTRSSYSNSNGVLMRDEQDSSRTGIYGHTEEQKRFARVSNVEEVEVVSPIAPDSVLRVSVNRGSTGGGLENMEFEKTVRGRLHWIGVMNDWKWEGVCKLITAHGKNGECDANF